MPTKTSCPTCGRALRVPDNLAGSRVKCPGCDAIFGAPANEQSPRTPGLPDSAPSIAPALSDAFRDETGPPTPPPSRTDEFPARLPARRFLDDEDDDDDFDDLPRRRRYVPHRGGTILTLGLVGLITCFLICPLCGLIGIAAVTMGQHDLREIREGRMDPAGHGQTQAGFIVGIIGIGFGVLSVLGFGLLIALTA
jgi:hypothetical protein